MSHCWLYVVLQNTTFKEICNYNYVLSTLVADQIPYTLAVHNVSYGKKSCVFKLILKVLKM